MVFSPLPSIRRCRILGLILALTIALFSDAYPPEVNGVATAVVLIRRELQRQGHTVYVFCPNYNRSTEDEEGVFRFFSIPFFFKAMRNQRFVFPTLKDFRRLKHLGVDIIHSHVPGNIGVLALLASWWYRIPHVHTYHTFYIRYTHYMPLPKSLSVRGVKWITRHFGGRCQRVICPSRQIRDEILSYNIDFPLDVIPTGIDLERTEDPIPEARIRRAQDLPPERRILTFVGRLGFEKNLGFLVDVAADLTERGYDLSLLFVGDGDARKLIRQTAEGRGIADRVRITGYVPREAVFSYCRVSDLFVFASMTETQGLVLLEAMSTGLPVVAIDAMGVSDLQADEVGGLLSSPDRQEFADKIALLLDNRELYERKRRGAVNKARLWSTDPMTRRLVACYEEAVRDYRIHGLPRYHRRNWEQDPLPEIQWPPETPKAARY
jgi:1,2-diacylglycerol 3-alpha-glucosyltransferase